MNLPDIWIRRVDKRYDGFIRSMGDIDNGESVLHMYHNGYIAATNNWGMELWDKEEEDLTSHPTLEDNNAADWGGLYGHSWDYMIENSHNTYYGPGNVPEWGEGWLAYNTFL